MVLWLPAVKTPLKTTREAAGSRSTHLCEALWCICQITQRYPMKEHQTEVWLDKEQGRGDLERWNFGILSVRIFSSAFSFVVGCHFVPPTGECFSFPTSNANKVFRPVTLLIWSSLIQSSNRNPNLISIPISFLPKFISPNHSGQMSKRLHHDSYQNSASIFPPSVAVILSLRAAHQFYQALYDERITAEAYNLNQTSGTELNLSVPIWITQ